MRSAAEQHSCELEEGAFKVGEGYPFVDGEALHLEEDALVGGVRGLVAVHAAGNHNPNGRLPALHHPYLHGRGVGAEEHRAFALLVFVVDPEGVPHVPGGVALGDIQRLEVVVVPLHLRPLHHLKPHAAEGPAYLPEHLSSRVQAAELDGMAGAA